MCVMCVSRSLVLFFFFSSRRRHTRLQGDWSSDVCSSDLAAVADLALDARDGEVIVPLKDPLVGPQMVLVDVLQEPHALLLEDLELPFDPLQDLLDLQLLPSKGLLLHVELRGQGFSARFQGI